MKTLTGAKSKSSPVLHPGFVSECLFNSSLLMCLLQEHRSSVADGWSPEGTLPTNFLVKFQDIAAGQVSQIVVVLSSLRNNFDWDAAFINLLQQETGEKLSMANSKNIIEEAKSTADTTVEELAPSGLAAEQAIEEAASPPANEQPIFLSCELDDSELQHSDDEPPVEQTASPSQENSFNVSSVQVSAEVQSPTAQVGIRDALQSTPSVLNDIALLAAGQSAVSTALRAASFSDVPKELSSSLEASGEERSANTLPILRLSDEAINHVAQPKPRLLRKDAVKDFRNLRPEPTITGRYGHLKTTIFLK